VYAKGTDLLLPGRMLSAQYLIRFM
jgi:hypothetical protein